jgi:hypothetical protein
MAKAKQTSKYQIVQIEWMDAFSEDGWKDISLLQAKEKTALCNTVGYLVLETDEFYHVANTVSVNEVACTMAIPKGMVISLKVL